MSSPALYNSDILEVAYLATITIDSTAPCGLIRFQLIVWLECYMD